MKTAHENRPWAPPMKTAHGHRPWAPPMGTAIGHRPWAKAMAQSHAPRSWPFWHTPTCLVLLSLVRGSCVISASEVVFYNHACALVRMDKASAPSQGVRPGSAPRHAGARAGVDRLWMLCQFTRGLHHCGVPCALVGPSLASGWHHHQWLSELLSQIPENVSNKAWG